MKLHPRNAQPVLWMVRLSSRLSLMSCVCVTCVCYTNLKEKRDAQPGAVTPRNRTGGTRLISTSFKLYSVA